MVCFTFKDGTDRLFRNVGNRQSTLRNIPEEQGSQDKIFPTHEIKAYVGLELHL